jgi:hypothetical protein
MFAAGKLWQRGSLAKKDGTNLTMYCLVGAGKALPKEGMRENQLRIRTRSCS